MYAIPISTCQVTRPAPPPLNAATKCAPPPNTSSQPTRIVTAKPAIPGSIIAIIPRRMNTTAMAINQPLAFLMIVPAPRNPSVGFAVAIGYLHSRLIHCAPKRGNTNVVSHTGTIVKNDRRGNGVDLPLYCRASVPVAVSFGPTWKSVTVNCVAVGFKCPENEKLCDPFTFSAVPPQKTEAPVTAPSDVGDCDCGSNANMVVTPFSTEVPETFSEKSGFWVITNVTTSAPNKLLVSLPLYVPFAGAMI